MAARAAERQAELRRNGSILDWVREDMGRLERKLGPADRSRMGEYLESVREIERRIQMAEHQDGAALPDNLERPIGAPQAWEEHVKLMFDLQVLALQADITRVITFQLAREVSTRTYPQIGVPEAHHPISHHANDPAKIAKLAKINAYHVSLFGYFLDRLKATPEGNGTLLDNSLYLLGSGMGNPDVHDHRQLPILRRRRGRRHATRRPPHPLRRADAARQPAADHARQGRDRDGQRSPTAPEKCRSSPASPWPCEKRRRCDAESPAPPRRPRARSWRARRCWRGRGDAADRRGEARRSRGHHNPAASARRRQRPAGGRNDTALLGGSEERSGDCGGVDSRRSRRQGCEPLRASHRFQVAALNGNAAMVELLLKAGADAQCRHARRRDGR